MSAIARHAASQGRDDDLPKTTEHEKDKEKKHHEKAVENTFPASDPPSTSQPGSGITGPNDPRERNPAA